MNKEIQFKTSIGICRQLRAVHKLFHRQRGGWGWKMLILADKGGRGVRQMLTLADKGGGVRQMLTLDDRRGRGWVSLILTSLTKNLKIDKNTGFL